MLPMIPLTIHTSSIDLNYCSSARLSEDKELMWRGFAPRRSVQSGHLCCRFQPILYDNSVYLFRHTSTPDFFLANAVHRIWTCKPFTANGFQDRSLTTRTYGIAQCAGFEPTKRINARPASNRLQFQLWEHCILMVQFLKQPIHYNCLPRTCQTVFLGSWVK